MTRPVALGSRRSLVPVALVAWAGVLLLPASSAEARRPHAREVGYQVTLGGDTFRIWGGRRTGIMPKGVSVSPDGRFLYVTNFGRRHGRNLDVYRSRDLTPLRRVDFAGNTIESLPAANGRTLFVTNMYGHLVQALDTTSWQARWSTPVGRFPKMMALGPRGRVLYVTSWESGTVSRLDAATGRILATSRRVGRHPRGLSVHPDGRTLYVALTGDKYVLALDTATLTVRGRVRTAGLPRHTALTRDGRRLFVTCIGGSLLQVIDTARLKVVRTVSVGASPRTLALSHDERFAYVADFAGHALTIVDTRTYRKRTLLLPIVKASGLAVRPDDRFVYVTGWCTEDVWAVQRLRPGQTAGPLNHGPAHRAHYRRDPATAWQLDCPRPRRAAARH